ncbi:hypothetical protein AB7828_15230 [Tardiphaga sp. 215_C5_N2_1]|uniref:hypothetical protein n=1 Tax=Tardiphaga sp. 215_C5_N2_1 TaxID=3240774 RepID=UPI003F8A4BAF
MAGDLTYLGISLNAQEEEFAAACRDFTLAKQPQLSAKILLFNRCLSISRDLPVIEAFLEHGLARLLKVMSLAVQNGRISANDQPKLKHDLALFKIKILSSVSRDNGQMLNS